MNGVTIYRYKDKLHIEGDVYESRNVNVFIYICICNIYVL